MERYLKMLDFFKRQEKKKNIYIYIYIYIYIKKNIFKGCIYIWIICQHLTFVFIFWKDQCYTHTSILFYICGLFFLPMARETWVQSQAKSYQRLKKWFLMPPCLTLSIIRYWSRVKRSNPEKGVMSSPTLRCSSYRKGSLWVANFTYYLSKPAAQADCNTRSIFKQSFLPLD